jgi:hypothetical protein
MQIIFKIPRKKIHHLPSFFPPQNISIRLKKPKIHRKNVEILKAFVHHDFIYKCF